jgi:hypothetical protein
MGAVLRNASAIMQAATASAKRGARVSRAQQAKSCSVDREPPLFRSQKFCGDINAINVGFVTSLILVLFIIGIMIALASHVSLKFAA